MTKPILFLLNGPMDCGKDYLADALCGSYPYLKTTLKSHLYELTNLYFNFPSRCSYVYHNKDLKDKVDIRFRITSAAAEELMAKVKLTDKNLTDTVMGVDEWVFLTPRQALIFVSEIITKPNLGTDYFAKVHLEKILEFKRTTNYTVFIEPSCGFQEEYDYYRQFPDLLTTFVIRIKGRGEFTTNDSRGWVFAPFYQYTIDNSLDLKHFDSQMHTVVDIVSAVNSRE